MTQPGKYKFVGSGHIVVADVKYSAGDELPRLKTADFEFLRDNRLIQTLDGKPVPIPPPKPPKMEEGKSDPAS